MKRILLTLALVSLLLPLAPRAQSATEVSLDFFYDNLSPYGSWYDIAGYGYCFQPGVAVSSSDWRPYSDGYWAYTDAGWTWVSYEDFGWATYHYGRWARLSDYGWVWVPGYEWGPAWVSWRTGGDYVGWAPLPPEAPAVYEGRVIGGHVDLEFNIGPVYYNFIDVRYIGEPVLRQYILPPARNVTIINRTVNVTNITYNNSVVNVYGPDYARINQYSARPVQRLTLRRETNVTNVGQGGRHGNFNRVNGNELTVVAPAVQKTSGKVAPKQVKAKVEKPKIEHGWQGVSNRQQLQAEMKKENRNNIPPPNVQPERGRKGEQAGSAQPGQQNQAARTNEQPPQRAESAPQAQEQRPGREERAQEREQQDARPAERTEANTSGQQTEERAGAQGAQNRPQQKSEREARQAREQRDRANQERAQQTQEREKARAQQAEQNRQDQARGRAESQRAQERQRAEQQSRQSDQAQRQRDQMQRQRQEAQQRRTEAARAQSEQAQRQREQTQQRQRQQPQQRQAEPPRARAPQEARRPRPQESERKQGAEQGRAGQPQKKKKKQQNEEPPQP